MATVAVYYLAVYIFLQCLAGVYMGVQRASFVEVVLGLVFHGLASFALGFLVG